MRTKKQLQDRVAILEEKLRELRRELETDPLTGLGNRRAIERRLHAREGWFVLADLNGFKKAQDGRRNGHAFGDRVLREFAGFLVDSCRAETQDRVAVRMGGDEFVVWAPSRLAALAIRNRIRRWHSGLCDVTASAGIGKDIPAADAAMYLDKERWNTSSRNA